MEALVLGSSVVADKWSNVPTLQVPTHNTSII